MKSSEELTYYPLPGFVLKKIVLEGKNFVNQKVEV